MKRNLLDTNHLSAYVDRQPSLEKRVECASLYQELREPGRMLSQFDLLIAAIARQQRLVVLTADADFQPVARLKTENWL